MPCPTEEELNQRPCYPNKIYPYQLEHCGPMHHQTTQIRACQPCVKVKVMKACGGQWTLFQELTLNSVPGVGTVMVIDGGSFKIESLLLLGNDGGFDSYEALVIPALQKSYEVGPWTRPQQGCGSYRVETKATNCGCHEEVNRCNPCERVPYPVYALKGYPW